ncbi:MAG: helix-turn-helix transcriptional regulator [Bacteroidota bacterium]
MIKAFAEKVPCEIPKELQPFVVAGIHGYSEKEVHLTFPIYPNGFPVLIHVYKSLPRLYVENGVFQAPSRLNLAGQIHNLIPKMEVEGYFGQIGFILSPLTPYYLFHIPGSSFINKWIGMDSLLPKQTPSILKELLAYKDPLHCIPILLAFLNQLLPNRLPPIEWLDQSLEEIQQQNGLLSIAESAEKVGISLRHFRRKFKEIVGVPPKYYCKVIQLNTIFEALQTSNNEALNRLALDCGYYDQAHFINDFKKFIGNSPEKFLAGEHAYVKTYLGIKGQ